MRPTARKMAYVKSSFLSVIPSEPSASQWPFLSPLLILGEGEGEVTRPDLRHTFRPQPPLLASRP